jgi:hypothetical protein
MLCCNARSGQSEVISPWLDYAPPELRRARVASWVRRHRVFLLALFGIAAAAMTAAIVDRSVVDARAEAALGRVDMSMDERQVLAALGQPSSRGTWTGSYGSGTDLYYEFPSVWDRMMQSQPRRVTISFRVGENQIFEVGTTAAKSKITRVVSRRDR